MHDIRSNDNGRVARIIEEANCLRLGNDIDAAEFGVDPIGRNECLRECQTGRLTYLRHTLAKY